MAVSLVGSPGAVLSSTANPITTEAWGVGESRTAGNLLICNVTARATAITQPTGWSTAFNRAVGVANCACFYKIAAGADAVPSVPFTSNVTAYVQLAEFTGNDASAPLDANGTNSIPTGGVFSATASTGTTTTGGLAIFVVCFEQSTGGSSTITWSALGAGLQLGTDGLTALNHYYSAYQLGPTSGAAATNTITSSGTSQTNVVAGIAVFKAAAGAAAQIWQPPRLNVNQAVQQSATW